MHIVPRPTVIAIFLVDLSEKKTRLCAKNKTKKTMLIENFSTTSSGKYIKVLNRFLPAMKIALV